MKDKKDERFRVISRLSRRSVGAKGDVSRAIVLSLMAWIFVAGPIAFAESLPDRPTVAEMDEIVRLGTECFHGANERCWATQYSTNPVAHRVAPFTNTAGFYLDPSLMGTMASTIGSLVPYYVDPATVYGGTTNIVMLTETGLFANLQIGNHSNQFTAIPASGTNAATFGPSAWRNYVVAWQERYKMLNALWKSSSVMSTPWMTTWSGMGYGLTAQDAYDDAVAQYAPAAENSSIFEQICAIAYWHDYRTDYFTNHIWLQVLQTQFVHTVSAFGGSVTQSGSGEAWTNVSECLTDNNTDAYVDIISGNSKKLSVNNFGFNLSTGTTVLGIQVEVKYKAPIHEYGVQYELAVTLMHPFQYFVTRTILGPPTNAYKIANCGGMNDLWGLTWTADNINDPLFGCQVETGAPPGDPRRFSVDYMKLTVTYMDEVPGNDSGGMYEGEHPLWIGPNNWIATYNATSNKYFITTNYDGGYNPSLPAWTLVGSSPEWLLKNSE